MANPTVSAIGRNIFPSTPCKERMGKYTIRMMICPKAAELIIRLALPPTALSICACVSLLFSFWVDRKCKDASTIITAPSTISPKSIAPRLIRLALTPNKFINDNANNKDKGIAEATIKPALKFPKNNTSINITINAPSIRFVLTVLMARSIRLVLSKKASISTSSGNDFFTVFILSLTSSTTEALLAPLIISTMPPTTSFSPL